MVAKGSKHNNKKRANTKPKNKKEDVLQYRNRITTKITSNTIKNSYGYSVGAFNKRKYASESVSDIDSDNSYEFSTDIYADACASQNLDYISNITFSNIMMTEDTTENRKQLNSMRNQLNLFLIQYIVDGFAANVDMITLKNVNIQKKIYSSGKWNILYKNRVYNTFDSYEDQIVGISTKKFLSDTDYDKFISNDYASVRKASIIRTEKLLELVQMKEDLMDILNVAIQKNAIPTLLLIGDAIDTTTETDVLDFLLGYKNASASHIDRDIVSEIKVIEAKVNSELIFKTFQLLNNEISALLGCSNSIFEAKGTELATSRTIDKVVLRNINSHRIMMEGVINEIAEFNNLGYQVELPLIAVDEYDNEIENTNNITTE